MSLNWKEIDLILNELDLPGMKIQQIYQSSFDILALNVYGKSGAHLLLISLLPLSCRFHESFRAVPKSAKPLRFAELLKSRLLNSRIEEAAQLGDNRIIKITLRQRETNYRLYIRLWSNAANVILTDEEGIIIDCMRRLPKRGETGGKIYKPEELSDQAAQAGTKQYEIRDLPGEGSFNRRVDNWYAEHGEGISLEKLKEEAQNRIGKNRNRLEAALERLREKEADYADGARYRQYGDLILSNTASIAQSSARDSGAVRNAGIVREANVAWLQVQLPPDDTGDNIIRIELDPRKSPAENAAHYYEKYRKAKNGLEELREEIAETEQELRRLSETEKILLSETNPFHLEALLKKIRLGPAKGSTEKRKKRPGIAFADGDWLIMVGRDAAENDELLRRHVKGNDLWLHVRDWSGSYVFIKHRAGKTVPLEILLDAGNLALFYSKGRNNKKGDLYYTQVKHLRRAKNGPKGLVIPTQEKNLSITLDDKRLKKLENTRI